MRDEGQWVCINCTKRVQDEGDAIDNRSMQLTYVTHSYDDQSQMCQISILAYATTVEEQCRLYDYTRRLVKSDLERLAQFSFQIIHDISSGRRKPRNDVPMIPTFESVSIRTDTVGYPMFVEEIEDWVNAHRMSFGFPTSVCDKEIRGHPLGSQFFGEELIVFSLFLETKELGAGLALFAGDLVGDDYD